MGWRGCPLLYPVAFFIPLTTIRMLFAYLRRGLLPLLAVLLTLPATAQKGAVPPLQLGQVTTADFASTPIQTTDSTAAEYLCDYGTTQVVGDRQGGFEAVHQRTARLRILRPTGYRYATVRVLLNVLNNDRAERISAVQGTTYNLVGGQPVATALDASQVFRKQLDQNLVECAFTLPNVKAGSIIEFTYTITSDFLYNLTPWEFEKDIPVRWSELRATLPEYLTFKTITRGTRPFVVEESRTVPYSTTIRRPHLSDERLTGSALALRWVLKDVPAFHTEPLMDAPVNYRKRIGFELAGTHLDLTTREYADISGQWKSLWESLQQHASFGRALTEPAPLAEAARQLRAQFPTDEEARAAAVLALVQARRGVQPPGRPVHHPVAAPGGRAAPGQRRRHEFAAGADPARGGPERHAPAAEHPRPRPGTNCRTRAGRVRLRSRPPGPARSPRRATRRHRPRCCPWACCRNTPSTARAAWPTPPAAGWYWPPPPATPA